MSIASTAPTLGDLYISQAGSTPDEIAEALAAMSAHASRAGSRVGTPEPIEVHPPEEEVAEEPQDSALNSPPQFRPANPDIPTRPELVLYASRTRNYQQAVEAVLDYLRVRRVDRPTNFDTRIASNMSAPLTIWRKAFELGEHVMNWERCLGVVRRQTVEGELQRAQSQQPQPQPKTGSGKRLKTPLPKAFNGKMGDPALAFLAACNNYKIMEPKVFDTEEVMIRWALQQMEDKASPWAIRQFYRMDTEKDSRGRIPKELRKWEEFAKFFMVHFGDPSEIERARGQWQKGLTQKGKCVDYFEIAENLLLKLGYDRDSEIVIDQLRMGLKPHVRTNFIGTNWTTLNEMKSAVIPYDSQHWQINNIQYGTPRASGSSNTDKTKTNTYFVKSEIAKNGATDPSTWRLPQEDFEKCQKNRWCFKCYKEGKEVIGSGKFHPNHSKPQQTTYKPKQNTKIATTSASQQDSRKDTDSDSDSETVVTQSKN